MEIIKKGKMLIKIIIGRLRFVFFLVVDTLLVATSVSAIGLFMLRFPTGTNQLDESWPLVCSIGSAEKMVFGTDLLLTVGPLSEIYTHFYHPITIYWIFPLSILLGLSYGFGLLFIIPRNNWQLKILMIFIAAVLVYLPDALMMAQIILPGIFIFQSLERQEQHHSFSSFWWMKFGVLLLPLSILPFVKGTFFSLTGIVCVLNTGILILSNRKLAAVVSLMSPLLLAICIWVGLGYSITDLGDYIQGSALIVSGYSEAMSIGPLFDTNIFLFGLASAVMVLTILFRNKSFDLKFLYLTTLFCLYLFLSFKGSFVRYDIHPLFYGLGILIAMVLFRSVVHCQFNIVVSALAILTYLSIDLDFHNSSLRSVYNNMTTSMRIWDSEGMQILRNKHQLDLKYQKSLESIHNKYSLDNLPGTTDMYSFNQMALLASENQYRPRPIFQSLSAFSPLTAKMNRDFLLGSNPPDFLFFKVETIDNRYPTLDDGMSWPVIIHNYTPLKYNGEYLILSKNNPKNETAPLTEEASLTKNVTSQVFIPETENPLFAEISLEKSFLGKLLSIFYKTPPVSITVKTRGGQQITRRFIAPMAENGFLLSPFINSTESFSYLFDDRIPLQDSKIEWLKLDIDYPILWKDSMSIRLTSFNRPNHFNIKSVEGQKTGVSSLQGFAFHTLRIDTLEQCLGHLDRINGLPVQDTNEIFLNTITFSGWLAHDPTQNTTWDEVFIMLTDESENTLLFPAERHQREDVAHHFNNPAMSACGFTLDADASTLKGSYSLRLLYRNGDTYFFCPKPSTTLKISE